MDKALSVPSCLQLQLLGKELQLAGRAGDWLRLGRADAELVRLAAHWAPPEQWGVDERSALQALKQAHAQASQNCAAMLTLLDETLIQMREGRSRWLAYAESHGWQDEGSAT